MQNNRRQFLGSLARGLLPPIGGGAVALAEPAKAAGLQITQGPLPLSADALRLRALKRDLRRCCESQDNYPSLTAYGDAWREITREIGPLEERIQQRPARSWIDCVELAEVAWWEIQHRGRDRYTNHAAVALTEAVLSLGGGERFYLYDKRSS
jgi:hypothetical protein